MKDHDPPIRIGTSGWYYDHWQGVLYPPKLPKAKRFEVYAGRYDTVEINATFYRLPSRSTVEGWHRKAAPGFTFVCKASKVITHKRNLVDTASDVEAFFEAIVPLRKKLGAVLFQLPPSLHKDLPLLSDFLALLPPDPPCAVEFRHASWECEEVYTLLDDNNAAHVVVSKKGYPFVARHTGPLAYYRLHGPEKLFSSPYSDEWLTQLAADLFALARKGVPSFTFFNNDLGGHAVHNADTLIAQVDALR